MHRETTAPTVRTLTLLGAALFQASCVETVEVPFESCTYLEKSVPRGAVVVADDQCSQCTCGSDGSMSCVELPCGCVAPDGARIENGATWTDGCTNCVCADNLLGCDTGLCGPCSEPAPECPQGAPLCVSQAECDAELGWYCITNCDCDPKGVPVCDVPLGCNGGPICDTTTGSWGCISPVCDCDGEVPTCDVLPGCVLTPVCEPMTGWYCLAECTCEGAPPNCGFIGAAECGVNGWECATPGSLCGEFAPVCPAMSPECSPFPICTEFQEWLCIEECPSDFCLGEPPVCPPDIDSCVYFQICSAFGWQCNLSCF